MNPSDLLRELAAVRPAPAGMMGGVLAGLEVRAADYHWDGRKRGIDPEHPIAILQYTLDGWGIYAAATAVYRVTPGRLFVAIVPSDHRYYLPAESPQWTFFYLVIRQDPIVQRLAETQRQCGPVVEVAPDSPLIRRMVSTWHDAITGQFRDELEAELSAFALAIEYQRFATQRLHPEAPRQRLLEETRAYIRAHLSAPIAVEALARRHGMSRSHFSHHFRATTGHAPGRFITLVRLEESMRLLGRTDQKLQAIARQCGFADANHFCKVFRRHYHMTPGEFRRQMR